MLFKVGEVVLVKRDLSKCRYGLVEPMCELRGKTFTIRSVEDMGDHYEIHLENDGGWTWDETCFVKLNNDASYSFGIERVIFNNPATIVFWLDGTKTIVKCQNDEPFDKEKGVALCFMKKLLGNKSSFNNVFKEFIPEEESNEYKAVIVNTEDLIGAKLNKGQIVTVVNEMKYTSSVRDEDGNEWLIGNRAFKRV